MKESNLELPKRMCVSVWVGKQSDVSISRGDRLGSVSFFSTQLCTRSRKVPYIGPFPWALHYTPLSDYAPSSKQFACKIERLRPIRQAIRNNWARCWLTIHPVITRPGAGLLSYLLVRYGDRFICSPADPLSAAALLITRWLIGVVNKVRGEDHPPSVRG